MCWARRAPELSSARCDLVTSAGGAKSFPKRKESPYITCTTPLRIGPVRISGTGAFPGSRERKRVNIDAGGRRNIDSRLIEAARLDQPHDLFERRYVEVEMKPTRCGELIQRLCWIGFRHVCRLPQPQRQESLRILVSFALRGVCDQLSMQAGVHSTAPLRAKRQFKRNFFCNTQRRATSTLVYGMVSCWRCPGSGIRLLSLIGVIDRIGGR